MPQFCKKIKKSINTSVCIVWRLLALTDFLLRQYTKKL